MVAATIIVCRLRVLCHCMASAWGVLLPCVSLLLLFVIDLSAEQLRVLIVMTMLITLIMLFSKNLRHFLLLPACFVLIGALSVMFIDGFR